MPYPIDGISAYPTVPSKLQSNVSDKQVSPRPVENFRIDTVNISDYGKTIQAKLNNNEMVQDSWADDPGRADGEWPLSTGMKEGKTTLENGNTQIVSIDGDNLEIQEFESGRLVKSVKGVVSNNTVALDTEFYDSQGRVSQSIQTVLEQGKGRDSWTYGTMSRSIEWFEDGKLTRKMAEEMQLQSKNLFFGASGIETDDKLGSLIKGATALISPDAQLGPSPASKEHHMAQYFGTIQEFGSNGLLRRDVTMTQDGEYLQKTNRNNVRFEGMEARTTVELSHKTELSVQVRDYDSNGQLIRDAKLDDSQKDGQGDKDGKQKQVLSVSWFNDGELIKQSRGSFSMAETGSAWMSPRPGILDMLNMKEGEYASAEPKSATELLGTNIIETGSEPDRFVAGLQTKISEGAYNDADAIAKQGAPDRPYEINWTDELYRDGELVLRQKDSEKATQYHRSDADSKGISFRTGGGLTENDNPIVLRETSHEREDFEDGQSSSEYYMKARETIKLQKDRPDQLITDALVAEKSGMEKAAQGYTVDGGLDGVDQRANSAAKGFSTEMGLTMDSLYDLFSSLNGEEKIRTRKGIPVNFTFGK